jgi:hypothetical protein
MNESLTDRLPVKKVRVAWPEYHPSHTPGRRHPRFYCCRYFAAEPEPLPADHRLVGLPNCIVLPHMGSNTWESRNSMSVTAAKNILAVFKDEVADGEVALR